MTTGLTFNFWSERRSKYVCAFLLAIISGWIFSSCKEDSDIVSSNSSLKISFSKDTLRFDTVFTTIKTATKRLLIYNKNKNAVNIESIKLMGGDGSFFRINVDGFSGDQSNVEIRGNDSMYVFVELTVDPQNEDNPILIQDSIQFITNGNTQYLHLEAYGQDVYIWNDKTITTDTTLTSERPFLIYDTLTIARGAQLNIEPGTKLYFHNKAGINVKGKINAVGSTTSPIAFRGDRTDELFSGVLYDNGVTGQWNGIIIDSVSYGNIFENVRIRSSIYGIYFNKSSSDQKKATLTNTIIHNVQENCVTATNCNIDFYNCQITNAEETCVWLVGGKYTFLHCTLANYFATSDGYRATGSETLYITNISGNSVIPLDSCNFTNCIIAGSGSNEVTLDNTLNGSEQTPFNHLFTRCLIKVNGSDDDNFIETIWNKDPEFVNLNTNGDYVFSFELDSSSVAIDAGDLNYSLKLPYDLNGNYRLSDDGPDLGCYERQKETSN